MRPRGALALAACVVVGCGADKAPAPRNTPEDALSGFYAAVLRDQDFRAACRFTAPAFYLRDPTAGAGAEEGEGDDGPLGVQSPAAGPRRGPCAELARYVYEKRGASQPFSRWRVRDVEIEPNERSAAATTTDGASTLEVVDGEWRLAWALK